MSANSNTSADKDMEGTSSGGNANHPDPSQRFITINGRKVGPGHPTYIIAEMSCNHAGDFAVAEAIVRAAAESGADAVKAQAYTADTITTDGPQDCFKINSGSRWDGMTLYKLYQEAYTPWDWMPKLKELANSLGMDFFASPFDLTSVDFLDDMGVPVFKIASFENGDIPLVKHIASKGKPIIMSTGMASVSVIEEALRAMREVDPNVQVCMLKCTSEYPAPPERCNLRTIPNMADTFQCVSGLSDHTTGTAVPVISVALGGCLIEKHFMLNNEIKTHDDTFSLTPPQFRQMVDDVRVCEKALGRVSYGDGSHDMHRRSLFVVEDIKAGDVFTEKNCRSIRPADGMHTRYYPQVLGQKSTMDLPKGTPLEFKHVQDFDFSAARI